MSGTLVWIKGSGWVAENATRWEVEWNTTPKGWDAMTEAERDEAFDAIPYVYRHFPSKALALAHARKVAPTSHFGCAMVRKVVPEIIEGDIAEWERVRGEETEVT